MDTTKPVSESALPGTGSFSDILAQIPDVIMSKKVTASVCDCPVCDCQNLVDGKGQVCQSCRHGKHYES